MTPDLVDDYRVLPDGEEFLMHDSGPCPQHVFSTRDNLRLLAESEDWFADGTFDVAPGLFQQLYTIHCRCYGVMLPLVFALLPGKSTQVYTRLLQALKDLEPRLAPKTLMSDFEQAAIRAFEQEFLNVSITGCFFHLGQCFWRKIQQLGFSGQYAEEDGIFASWARCLPALAFLPVDEVVDGFETLASHDAFNDAVGQNAAQLVDYFEDTWVGRPPRRQGADRRQPMFPHQLWNQHHRTLDGLPRTNNSVEAWRNRMQALIGA